MEEQETGQCELGRHVPSSQFHGNAIGRSMGLGFPTPSKDFALKIHLKVAVWLLPAGRS